MLPRSRPHAQPGAESGGNASRRVIDASLTPNIKRLAEAHAHTRHLHGGPGFAGRGLLFRAH